MLQAWVGSMAGAEEFQSSPGPKAGCYDLDCWIWMMNQKFQSSPGPKAGCYDSPFQLLERLVKRFNPHPARKPDATL